MWYYLRGNRRVGPVAETEMAGLIGSGKVLRKALVWSDGMDDWVEAGNSSLKGHFRSVPPPVPGLAVEWKSYKPRSFRRLWLWYVWLTVIGVPLSFAVVGFVPLLAAMVVGWTLLYRCWRVIQDGDPRTTPGKAVGLSFIPFFQLYWWYVAFVGLARDINVHVRKQEIEAPKVSEGLALTLYVSQLVAVAVCLVLVSGPLGIRLRSMEPIASMPYLGAAIALVTAGLLILLMKQFADAAACVSTQEATDPRVFQYLTGGGWSGVPYMAVFVVMHLLWWLKSGQARWYDYVDVRTNIVENIGNLVAYSSSVWIYSAAVLITALVFGILWYWGTSPRRV